MTSSLRFGLLSSSCRLNTYVSGTCSHGLNRPLRDRKVTFNRSSEQLIPQILSSLCGDLSPFNTLARHMSTRACIAACSLLFRKNSSDHTSCWLPDAFNFSFTHSANISSGTVLHKKPNKNDHTVESFKGEMELDDDVLHDPKYVEMFAETYLRPILGQRVYAIQPDVKDIPAKSKLTTSQLQLNELCALIETLPNWTVVGRAIHSVKAVDKRHFFGKGKLAELTSEIHKCKGVTAVVVGVDMLNSVQLATLQDLWGVAVYDRYTVVLQIFSTRARTKEAKLQVALAEIPYYRSRLRGMHSGTLDQQKGGMKFVGGSGETYIELRKRLLEEREVKLRKEVGKLRSQREILRKQRRRHQFPVIAVVGYTNAGKTSLIKALTGEQSLQPRDQLFATLDVTLHAGLLPNRLKVLYVDTIGFISDIPTALIESFTATLEDIATAILTLLQRFLQYAVNPKPSYLASGAHQMKKVLETSIDAVKSVSCVRDVVIHVRDVSHPNSAAQKHNVLRTLQELQLPDNLLSNMIEVCNKIDLVLNDNYEQYCGNGLPISVNDGRGLVELQNRIMEAVAVATGRRTRQFRLPLNGPHLAWLYKEATVEATYPDETDSEKILVSVIMTDSAYSRFQATFGFGSKLKS